MAIKRGEIYFVDLNPAKGKEQIPLSRLEVLSLIYNGFVSMFAPEQAKKSIIRQANKRIRAVFR